MKDEVTIPNRFANLEGSNQKETIDLVNKAEEGERTRRMSIPFSCDVEETDLDISVTSGQLSNVHQELLHLFAIHDVSFFLFLFLSAVSRCNGRGSRYLTRENLRLRG